MARRRHQRPNMRFFARLNREVMLRQALSRRLEELAEEMREQGTSYSWDQLNAEMERISEEHGAFMGIPLPSIVGGKLADMEHAEGGPLGQLGPRTSAEEVLAEEGAIVRNSWNRLGDKIVTIVEEEGKPKVVELPMVGERMRLTLKSILTRSGSQLTAEAELKAMNSLKKRVSEAQWNAYVLNGSFMEKSPRSDLHYWFRKGLPTVALSFHGSETGRVLACLCLHPMGYHSNTFAGMMTPSDDVIAHLLLMRADEHRFWKMSGQHPSWDPRSGL